MIQHLSFPDGDSINDWIDREYCAVQYTHFDQAVEGVVRVGKGALTAKEDIESAFRLLPVHLREFNGISIFQDHLWVGAADLQLYTDTSGEIRFGGFLSGSWFQDRWPVTVLREGISIAWKEFSLL